MNLQDYDNQKAKLTFQNGTMSKETTSEPTTNRSPSTETLDKSAHKFHSYLVAKSEGKIDPESINFMIETLIEWLPYSVGYVEEGYSLDAYELGQREYKDHIMCNLK